VTGPGCPHGTKVLAADGQWWLCPGHGHPAACRPEKILRPPTEIPKQQPSPAAAQRTPVITPQPQLQSEQQPTAERSSVPVWEWQAAIRDAESVTGKRQEVAFVLSTYATPTTGRDVRPAAATVAKAVGMTREKVYGHIGALRADGWLYHYATAKRGVKVYALTVPVSPRQTQ
jgi:hypothetical protein